MDVENFEENIRDASSSSPSSSVFDDFDLVEFVNQTLQSYMSADSSFFVNEVNNFILAINWSEPFLLLLGGFHFLVFLLICFSYKKYFFQSCLFFSLVFCVYISEWLNRLGQHYWIHITTQPYFEPHGTFIAFLWSFPILLQMLLLVIMLIAEAGSLLISVKRKELRYKKTRNISSSSSATTTTTTTTTDDDDDDEGMTEQDGGGGVVEEEMGGRGEEEKTTSQQRKRRNTTK